MPLAKCVRCDKLFNKTEDPICPACMPSEVEDFDKVRECLNENADVNAEQVSELTGVDIKVVMRMIDAGSVSVASLDSESIKCGQCGAPAISASKKLCQNCLEKLNQKMLQTRKNIEIDSKKKVQLNEFASVRKAIEKKKR